jgi:hypothetical protein
MNTTLWVALSVIVSALIGVTSGLITNLLWPGVRSKQKLIWSAFGFLVVVAIVLLALPASGLLFRPKTWNLIPGQTLYVSSGGLRYKDYECGKELEQICVLLYSSSYAQAVTLNDLPVKLNADGSEQPLYYDAVREAKPEQILREQENSFWSSTNCGGGCAKATVVIIEDGIIGDSITLNRP